MSQVPAGDRSEYVVKYEFDPARRDTFERFVDELHRFIDGKSSSRSVLLLPLPTRIPAIPHHSGWLGSRVVSVLDSGAVGPGFKLQPRRCRVTVLGKLFTPIVPLFTKQQNW